MIILDKSKAFVVPEPAQRNPMNYIWRFKDATILVDGVSPEMSVKLGTMLTIGSADIKLKEIICLYLEELWTAAEDTSVSIVVHFGNEYTIYNTDIDDHTGENVIISNEVSFGEMTGVLFVENGNLCKSVIRQKNEELQMSEAYGKTIVAISGEEAVKNPLAVARMLTPESLTTYSVVAIDFKDGHSIELHDSRVTIDDAICLSNMDINSKNAFNTEILRLTNMQADALKFFATAGDMFCFAALHMDGKSRCDALGVRRIHYCDKWAAANWYMNVCKEIDNCTQPDNIKAKAKEVIDRTFSIATGAF